MASYGATRTQENEANITRSGESALSSSPSRQPVPAKLTVPQKDLVIFFRQLSVILESGIPLAQGLTLIAENMSNKKLSHCIDRIAGRLGSGEELSISLKQYPKVFKPIMIGLIEAGEAGGILEKVLDRIATLMEEQAKLRGQIIGALVYPVIVFVLAISVSLGLLIFIVPRFDAMFRNMGGELPALTAFMMMLSQFVTSTAFLIGAPVLIIGGLFLFRGFYATKEGQLTVDSLIFKIPLFGDLIQRTEMAGLCDTLSTLVNSGIPVVDGLERCIAASSNERIRISIRRAILLVQQGQELNASLGQSRVFPKLVISMIRIGEETGQLSFMLEKLSIFYKREVESTVTALTKAMEPAVIGVVAVIVGTIVISLYLPMFSLITEMGN